MTILVKIDVMDNTCNTMMETPDSNVTEYIVLLKALQTLQTQVLDIIIENEYGHVTEDSRLFNLGNLDVRTRDN